MSKLTRSPHASWGRIQLGGQPSFTTTLFHPQFFLKILPLDVLSIDPSAWYPVSLHESRFRELNAVEWTLGSTGRSNDARSRAGRTDRSIYADFGPVEETGRAARVCAFCASGGALKCNHKVGVQQPLIRNGHLPMGAVARD